jgi:hypothetical protein
MDVTVGALLLLGLGGYLVSVRRHPFRPCRRCKGVGRHFGAVFGRAYRPCRWCGGLGRRPRLGARLVRNV